MSLLRVLLITGAAWVGVVSQASGAPSRPSVLTFSVTPSQLDSTGGSVNVAATVAHATACTINSVPKLTGLPLTVGCSSGTVSQALVLPANTSPLPQPYLFRLTATAAGATAQSLPVLVTVAAPPKTEYVVVFRDGVDAAAKARLYRATPDFVYSHALSGFAARLGPIQRALLNLDRDVLMVTPADRDASLPAQHAQGSTPIENFPQVVPHNIQRVGGLLSPTAQINGIDERVNADVAVLDSGIDPNQPDLNVAGGVNCNGNTGFTDVYGHGTMVAGVVGALDNSFGVVGIAPGVRLWSVKVLDDANAFGTDANLLCGLDWVAEHSRTIHVANMSLLDIGSDDGHCGLANHDPVHWGICHVYADGVTLVAAAGNDSVDTTNVMPAGFHEVIAVSATVDTDGKPGGLGPLSCLGDPDDTFTFFSNFGQPVDIAAPGECIGSTLPNGEIAVDSGTSYSAPAVAGAAALYLAKHPGASPETVKAAILQAAEPGPIAGDPDAFPEGVLNVASF